MCGIVGYSGNKQAVDVLIDGLQKLEYRGYDSAGIAVVEDDKNITVVKAVGKLNNLTEKLKDLTISGTVGIGHTRWATHGKPSMSNSHPHTSDCVTGVHNGIIENFEDIKKKLVTKGYQFYSQTDTEVLIKLVDYYYKKYYHDPVYAISKTTEYAKGSYALAVLFNDHPNEVYAVRKDAPLIVGNNNTESILASDISVLADHTSEVYYLENYEICCLNRGEVKFYNTDMEEIYHYSVHINTEKNTANKNGYRHYMLKEIYEQPEALRNNLKNVYLDGSWKTLSQCSSICIIACGSAYHVGLALQPIFEKITRIPTTVEYASEFRYKNPILKKDSLVIAISQSGETADTLAALRLAKSNNVKTYAIVNVENSSIAREADKVIYTCAGPEIAVATTKAYSNQLMSGYYLALNLALLNRKITADCFDYYIKQIQKIPEAVEEILKDTEDIKKIANIIYTNNDIFFIGRGSDYAVSMEGSLKLKEVSYIHSEAYPAGELKHGTISLIERGTPVIGILTQPNVYLKTLSNMQECKARGGMIIAVTSINDNKISEVANYVINITNLDHYFMPSLAVVPLQLLAYYVAVAKGLDVDKPRNLAKSVTVE